MNMVLMFKTLVPSALYNLSDDQIEYQVRDRLSFMRFLGLGDRVPDAKAGMVDELFAQFDGYPARRGYIARGGQILDASIVPVPHNYNKRAENTSIKVDETPKGRADKSAKRSQKHVDAGWTRKHSKSRYATSMRTESTN
jgi:IS5 family transposase